MCNCFAGSLLIVLSVSAVGEDRESPSLGLVVVTLSDILPKLKELKSDPPAKAGVFVMGVMPKGPAAEAKIPPLSVITRVNQKLVKDKEEFVAAIDALELGKPVAVAGFAPVEIGKTVRWRGFTVRPAAKKWRDVVFNGLEGKEDAVTGSTTYRHVDSPEFVNERSELFAAFTVTKEGSVVPSLHVQYVASDWVFIRNVTIKADDRTFSISPKDLHSDNNGGKVWEWFASPIGEKEREMLDAMVSSKTVIIRCEGADYNKDRDMEVEEKARLYVMLEAIDLLSKK